MKKSSCINSKDIQEEWESILSKRLNHAYTIAFSVETDNDKMNVTNEELLHALKKRVSEIESGHDCDMIEACGLPFDTYENP